ncbi:MAG: hypothetical protein JW917_03680 [Ignavibacteria bacterium]|nr:hypothetical protein [Ignavibacteria bacterium]
MKNFLPKLLLVLVILLSTGTIFAQPSPPTLLAPPNNSTGVSLFPTFDWTDVTGATSYRIQIFQGANTILDQAGLTVSQYTVITAILIPLTQYYWRVNATGPSGTSAWTSYWYFTTGQAIPAAPQLVSPANNSTGVSITPVLDWNDVTGATSYGVQVSTNSGFTTTLINVTGLTGSGYVVPSGILNNGITYYWRANASNSSGSSPWSSVWQFTTVISPPLAPNLITPPNGATGVSTSPTMYWSGVSGAISYHIQISQSSQFTSLVYDQTGITSTSHTIPSGNLVGQTQYFWRVSAINAGGEGPYSTVFNFTTGIGVPAAPFLLAPANNTTGVPRTPTLDWSSVPNATSYRVQVSTDTNFTNLVINIVTGSSSQYTVPSNILSYGTLYYWRANATNASGTGPWSLRWNFTTIIQPPSAPTLLSPPNLATGISLTPALDWTDVSGSDYYRVQISTSSTFSTTVIDITNISVSNYTVPSGNLSGNTIYYWRVCGYNAGGQGVWASYFRFTTLQAFSLGLKVYLEGFYNGITQVEDTVTVYLALPTTPFTFVDNSKVFLSSSGTATLSFGNAANGNYYIVVKHRNHIETWSSNAMPFATGQTVNYDFTTAQTKAYGGKMKQVGSAWVLYGGDANADGFIDPADYELYKPEFGKDGYRSCDFNGDNYIDGYDLLILYPNFGISISRPY